MTLPDKHFGELAMTMLEQQGEINSLRKMVTDHNALLIAAETRAFQAEATLADVHELVDGLEPGEIMSAGRIQAALGRSVRHLTGSGDKARAEGALTSLYETARGARAPDSPCHIDDLLDRQRGDVEFMSGFARASLESGQRAVAARLGEPEALTEPVQQQGDPT